MSCDSIDSLFKCKHCNREYKYDEEIFNIAIFLYGIFFLTDEEYCYTGITCPLCLKTIINRSEKVQAKNIWMSANSFQAFDIHQPISLRYHSSYAYNTFQKNKHVQKRSKVINYFNGELLDEDLATFRSKVEMFKQEFNLFENHFCTYSFDDDLPMGSSFYVGWFQKDDIDYFIKIENDNSLRLFPRYIPYYPIYDTIELFCWKYYSYREYMKNINIPEDFKSSDNIDDRKFNIPTDFLSILVDDPFPLVFEYENDAHLKSFWKTMNPLLNKKFSKDFFDCDLADFEKPQKGPSHDKKASLVKKNIQKRFVQDFLFEHYEHFIKEYINLSSKIDFSYAAIWQLKEGYLDRLYDIVTTKESSRLYQSHKSKCREVADKIWKDEIKKNKPITTIADMMLKDEVNEVFGGKSYSDSTMRKWIKDLCPNRKPGARPKNKSHK